MKKFLPLFALIFLVSAIAIATYKLGQKQENQRLADEENYIAFGKVKIILPEFSFPDLLNNDESFSNKDLKGKFSLINFFASWCTTCAAEHDVLLQLQNEKIIDIYGVAWRDIDENTKKFLQENGNPFTKVAKDNAGLFSKITGLEAVPESLIVDKEGNVVMRFRGNLQEFSINEIREFLAQNN